MSPTGKSQAQSQVGQRKAANRNQANKKQQQQRKPRPPRGMQSATKSLGAESTSVAAAYSAPVKNNRPNIVYGPQGRSCRVIHKEFIQNVSGTVNFTIPIFLPLNPGLIGTFPWLANIANNFEQYRCNRMRFCYLTRTGTNIPGSVLMAPDYDAADVAPVSEQIMSNYAEIVEDAPWKDICCLLRPSGMHALGPKKFVRSGLVPGQDLKTTDVGSFILATTDGTAVSWGKLWVEYDFEFFEPQLNAGGNFAANSTAQGTAGTAAAFISAGGLTSGSNIASIVGNVVNLSGLTPNGEYALFIGASTSASSWGITALTGSTIKTNMFSTASNDGFTFTVNPGSTVTQFTLTWTGNVVSPFLLIAPITPGPL
jgi:hypothetical protein